MSSTVLVVSDDPEVSEELRFALDGAVDVLGANDGQTALDSLQRVTPDVVVVDLKTGRSGGFALAKDMSQSRRLASVPIMILLERSQDRWLAEQAGAAVVLRKPIDGRRLAAEIANLLNGSTLS